MTDARANEICARLKELGQRPVWAETADGKTAIGFELISQHPFWVKAFYLETATATPEMYIALLDNWKDKVRKEIAIGLPSTVVQNAIRAHGIIKVSSALKTFEERVQ